MKLPLPLLAVIAAPLLFVAARAISPRASIAQTTTPSVSVQGNETTLTAKTPVPSPTPLTISAFYRGWGAIEGIEAVPDSIFADTYELWALQKTAMPLPEKKFNARLWINGITPVGQLKVIFHTRFADGSPCGTWDEVTVEAGDNGRLDAISTFHTPTRTGLGFIWAEVQGMKGEKIGEYEQRPFAVLPLGLTCSTTEWEAAKQENEWSREIHVFAGPQVPPSWKSKYGTVAFSKFLNQFYSLKPVAGVPIRLVLSPAASPLIRDGKMPLAQLSVTRGKSAAISIPKTTVMSRGAYFTSTTPRFVATQTVKWKLGDSNQIDCAQISAQIDWPAIQKGSQQ